MNHSLIFFEETDYIYSFTDKLKKQTYLFEGRSSQLLKRFCLTYHLLKSNKK
jgi:hypothetical protein